MKTIIPTGVSYYQKEISKLKIGDKVTFKHIPMVVGTGDNRKEYPNAVQVQFKGKQVGSLSDKSIEQEQVIGEIQKGNKVIGIVTSLRIPKKDHKFVRTYTIDVDLPDLSNIIKPFNEDIEITFDHKLHKYTYNDIPLLSATKWVSQFYEKFDKSLISERCAKAWQVPQRQIIDMWSSNGDLTRDFGHAVHAALEHWDKYRTLGEKIVENSRKTENPAMPKHSFLQKIIKDFEKVCPETEKVIPEAIITDVKNFRCGTVDRLVLTGEKSCRIGDYKVNVEVNKKGETPKPPFDKLPPTKLTKYQLQMSFYAKILQNTGWKVEGLDAYVFENEWKHYEMGILEIEN